MKRSHHETHRLDRIGWLRASVLGANDGIVSTSSLIAGVASAHATHASVLISAVAGLTAGAMAMAAGEYVSVSSQADTEKADLARERVELATDIQHEYDELAQIYEKRGLEPKLARQVAEQLMEHDALGSHARDELGILELHSARPLQAALASALSFSLGAVLPLTTVALVPLAYVVPIVAATSLLALVSLGAMAAKIGGANPWKGALRVGFWGALAIAFTAGIGFAFGTII